MIERLQVGICLLRGHDVVEQVSSGFFVESLWVEAQIRRCKRCKRVFWSYIKVPFPHSSEVVILGANYADPHFEATRRRERK